jgi:transposase
VSEELINWRKRTLKGNQETTLIFDKGNISEEAMTSLIIPNQKFVCAIPKTTDPVLFATDIDSLIPVSGLPGTRATHVFVELWSKKLKIVVAYSESFFAAELVELTESIRKCEKQLHDLEKWLEKGPSRDGDAKWYSLSRVNAKINDIQAKPHLKSIIKVTVQSNLKATHISYVIDQKQLEIVIRTSLGRTLLLSSQLKWSEEEIISAYRSQQNIEEVFKHMKNREYLHWQPSFHWTDQKIKVHSFYSVMALLLATLAHKTAVQSGIDITLLNMLDELNDIREVALISTDKTKSTEKDRIVLSRMSCKQKRLAEVLEIQHILKG